MGDPLARCAGTIPFPLAGGNPVKPLIRLSSSLEVLHDYDRDEPYTTRDMSLPQSHLQERRSFLLRSKHDRRTSSEAYRIYLISTKGAFANQIVTRLTRLTPAAHSALSKPASAAS
jgi:hypothetical protein